MPGERMFRKNMVMPLCLGTLGSVRVMRMPQSECWAPEVQIFWPLITHSSPCFSARVRRPARSEPPAGSEKSWHQMVSPAASGGSSSRFCSSVAKAITVGPHMPWPMMKVPARLE